MSCTPWQYVARCMDTRIEGVVRTNVYPVYIADDLYDAAVDGLTQREAVNAPYGTSFSWKGVHVAPNRERPPREVQIRASRFNAEALNKFINDPTLKVIFADDLPDAW
jgi:hypothetical protein